MRQTITTPECIFCGRSSVRTVSASQFMQLAAGTPVHVVFPDTDTAERELLISGTHPHCWPSGDDHHAPIHDATRIVERSGFGDLISGTSGGGCPITVAGPMLAAHWAQIAWHDVNEAPEAVAERNAAHLAAIRAWAGEVDGAGNFAEAMGASVYAWTFEAAAITP